MRAVLVCLGALAAASIFPTASSEEAPARGTAQYFPMKAVDGQSLPFSEAVRVGDTLYLSGQVGNAPGTLELVPGGTLAQARQVMENIKAILQRHGSSLDRVVKCTVFLTDMKDWPAFNDVYRQYFRNNLPARSALGANGLALGARVEVECIAVVP
jgi:2-iminobutanoate/2-iminopropanoate deaminase